MNEEKIRAHLKKEYSHLKIITVNETASTNDELKKSAVRGEREEILLAAEKQTAGRGRRGRSFFSPVSTGIYMSLLLHPRLSAEDCTLITPLCAVAVCEAVENVTGIKADIKWVNDIFVCGKKVAGILTEGSFTEKGADYVIVGIGINLSPPEEGFPEEIRDTAGALTDGSADLRCQLIAEIVNIFMHRMESIGSRSFISDYRSRLFFLGKEITVISPDGSYTATAEDIDRMCRLRVRTQDGETKILGSGEISVKI